MADRFAMDFGESSIRSVRKVSEEAARFGGIPVPAAAPAGTAVRGPLFDRDAPLVDSLSALVASEDGSSLSLAGCERFDTHVRSDVKRRMKVFCAMHGLNLRQVSELAFEAVAAAMDEYESRAEG